MIAIMTKCREDGGSSLHYLLSYISKETKTKIDDVLKGIWYRNLAGETTQEIVVEMRDIMDGYHKNRDPRLLRHFIVSWPQNEIPTLKQVEEVGDYMLKSLGAEDLQAVFALHQNTDNYHLHIVVNRVNFDGRPVDLANRWEVKAIQKAARELELKYGWSIQHNGLYDVDKDGNIYETGITASVKKKAKDFETFTGEKSEQRKLASVCGKIFDKCKNWNEIHQSLNQLGVSLHQKGSGGILIVNNVAVKLSSIGRDYSWGQMVKRYGEFQNSIQTEEPVTVAKVPKEGKEAAETEIADTEPPVAPLENLEDLKNLLKKGQPILATKSWPTYHQERTEYMAGRKQYTQDRIEAKKTMIAAHKTDHAKLMAKINNDRYQLNLTIMSGKEKNMVRKELALVHAREMAALRRTIKIERHAWNISWPKFLPGKFPSYKEWLKEGGQLTDLATWVNRRRLGSLAPGEEIEDDDKDPAGEILWRSIPGILAFHVAKADNTGYIYYELIDKTISETAFVDAGPVIKVFMEGETSILAAMQLAISKWGSITVNGDAEFQRKCFEVALRHGIRVKNPEFELIKKTLGVKPVQDSYRLETIAPLFTPRKEATKSEELHKETKPKMTGQQKVKARENLIRDFELYHQALGADRYRVTSIFEKPDGKTNAWVLDKNKETKETIGFLPDEVRKGFSLIMTLAEKEEALYFTPLSEDRHHILIDGLTLGKLEAMIADGYAPAYVQESSPGNYQAIINIPKLETASPEINNDILNIVFRRLNEDYGDPELQGGIHPHRIPSTPNVKPKYRKTDGSYPLVRVHKAEFCICEKTLAETQAIYEKIKAENKKVEAERAQAIKALLNKMDTPPPAATPQGGGKNTGKAYLAHIADIQSEYRKRGRPVDPFLVDSMVVIRLRVTGHDQDGIKDALRQYGRSVLSDAREKSATDYEAYITQIVDKYAFAAQGDLEVAKWSSHMGRWFHVEFAEMEATLQMKARTPVGELPEIPQWILDTDEQRQKEGLTEAELALGETMLEGEIIGEMPTHIPEPITVEEMKLITEEKAKAENAAENSGSPSKTLRLR